MRIAILSKASTWGGAEAHALGLAEALQWRGHDVCIVGMDEDSCGVYRARVGGRVPVLDLAAPKPVHERHCLDWLSAFRKLPAEACVLEKGTLHSGNLALDVAARLRFRRYVTIEQLEPLALPPRTSRRYLRGLLPGLGLWWYRMLVRGYLRSLSPHTVVTVSDSTHHLLRRDYRFGKRKLLTVWNGADVARYRPDPAVGRAARERWGVRPGTLVFGSVRRFSREKGLDLAVEAFYLFRRARPDRDAVLVLVGDGEERAALERLAVEKGVRDRVIFPGFTAEPWTAYPGMDIFVMPSRSEALSLSLVEAMASGCLAIASRVGGSAEVISHPSLGWVVPPEDPEALAQAMAEVAGLPAEEREARARHGRSHVSEHFDAPGQYAKVAAVIENGAGWRKRAARSQVA